MSYEFYPELHKLFICDICGKPAKYFDFNEPRVYRCLKHAPWYGRKAKTTNVPLGAGFLRPLIDESAVSRVRRPEAAVISARQLKLPGMSRYGRR